MYDYEQIGWIYDGDLICDSCCANLSEEKQKECSALLAGEVEGFLNKKDRSILCAYCKDYDIWEADSSYAEKYQKLEGGFLGKFSCVGQYWCVECSHLAEKGDGTLRLDKQTMDFLSEQECVCVSCDDPILSQARNFAHHFQHEWDIVFNAWVEAGFFKDTAKKEEISEKA